MVPNLDSEVGVLNELELTIYSKTVVFDKKIAADETFWLLGAFRT